MEQKKLTKEYSVTEEILASNVGSGTLRVLATPAVSAFFEGLSAEVAQAYLEDGFTTVGTKISVEHLAPTAQGAKVTVTAELTEQSGRVFRFNLTASDSAGLIATGKHERVSVNADRFLQKAQSRKSAGVK